MTNELNDFPEIRINMDNLDALKKYQISDYVIDVLRHNEFNIKHITEDDLVVEIMFDSGQEVKLDYDKDGSYEKQLCDQLETQVDKTMADELKDAAATACLLVCPGKYPEEIKLNTFKDLEREVGGCVEYAYPFDDDVCLVYNEDGKAQGLDLNRALYDSNGDVCDIIAGNFLIVGCTTDCFGIDYFASLSPELMNKYEKMFHNPEKFVQKEKEIAAVSFEPETEKHKHKGRGM